MPELRDLPLAELEVMEIVWQRGEATVRDVHTVLSNKRRLAYKTVGTLLGRLRDKGYVEAEERDFAYVFRPLVPRSQVVFRKVDDLVTRVLGGDLTPLALYMAEHGDSLTNDQIDALDEIVKATRKRRGRT